MVQGSKARINGSEKACPRLHMWTLVEVGLSFMDMLDLKCRYLLIASLWCATAGASPATPASTASTSAPPARTATSSVPIIPLSEVRAGMTGYGLTVFQGTKPEKFNVRVISVLHHFLPKMDVILIQSDDERLKHSGIVAGMSGSPIYLDGRLAGALAYGWHFAKDPLAGVTPIENMMAELKRPLRGKALTPFGIASNEAEVHRPRSLDDVIADRESERKRNPLLARLPLPPKLLDGAEPRLVRASVPLSLAGFGAGAFSALSEAFEPYHMVPLAAGGAARKSRPGDPKAFENGGAIAVQLIRGDVSAAATGTVTYMEGDKVLAFGPPMFNVGEIYLPVATAEIHTFMSAVSSSFKLSSPLSEIGSLVQDRQTCIMGDTSQRAEMIPVHVTVGGPGRPNREFEAEVVRHRFLTPVLASMVITNAGQTSVSDVADATITVRSNIQVRGHKPLELTDHMYSPDGLSPRVFAQANGLKAIGDILFNPFSPASLDRIEVAVDVDFKADVAEIVGVSLGSDELEPGSRPSLYVTLRPYAGREYVQAIPFDVPRALAGQQIKLTASAGNLSRPDVAPPENLGNVIENLRKSYPARSIVVSVETPDEGVTLRGSVIPDLPGSVIDTLRPGASSRRADTFKRAARVVTPTRGVMVGKQEITARVRDDQTR